MMESQQPEEEEEEDEFEDQLPSLALPAGTPSFVLSPPVVAQSTTPRARNKESNSSFQHTTETDLLQLPNLTPTTSPGKDAIPESVPLEDKVYSLEPDYKLG